MDRIAVIDFETANNSQNSACQFGIVLMEEFRIVHEQVWLVRPPQLYFSPYCVQVHGLTASDCRDAPRWKEIWKEVRPLLEGSLVIAHNVSFDAKVLFETNSYYQLELPSLETQCSRLIAKRAWPELTGHGLANVASHLELKFKHHDALEDARASALVASKAANKQQVSRIDLLEEQLGLVRGTITSDKVVNPRTSRKKRAKVKTLDLGL